MVPSREGGRGEGLSPPLVHDGSINFDLGSTDLGIDFGALLGAFGGSISIIFGINFGMIFACRSKSGLRAPKSDT